MLPIRAAGLQRPPPVALGTMDHVIIDQQVRVGSIRATCIVYIATYTTTSFVNGVYPFHLWHFHSSTISLGPSEALENTEERIVTCSRVMASSKSDADCLLSSRPQTASYFQFTRTIVHWHILSGLAIWCSFPRNKTVQKYTNAQAYPPTFRTLRPALKHCSRIAILLNSSCVFGCFEVQRINWKDDQLWILDLYVLHTSKLWFWPNLAWKKLCMCVYKICTMCISAYT